MGVDFNDPLTLAAYIISIVGFIILTLASACKRKNMILAFQSASNVLVGLSEGLIGAWSGLAQDAINLLRNIFVLKKWMTKTLSIVFIILCAVVGGIVFYIDYDKHGLWCLFPAIATLQYSIIILIPNVKVPVIKLSIMISSTLWAIYGVAIRLYTTTIFNSISFILCVISLIVYFVKNKNKIEENKEVTSEVTEE